MVDLSVVRIIDLLTDGVVDLFLFVNTDRTLQFKLNAQFLRLFGVHSDVNDAHRAGANRLKKQKQNKNDRCNILSLLSGGPCIGGRHMPKLSETVGTVKSGVSEAERTLVADRV